MAENQTFMTIEPVHLSQRTIEMKNNGYRLAQICCTKKENFEIIYSFAKATELTNLKIVIPFDQEIESISAVYPYSFLYENEMKDLFGVKICGMNLDFKGNFYHTRIKTPFHPEQAEEQLRVTTVETAQALENAAKKEGQ